MKKICAILITVSILVSALSIFYVIVGAASADADDHGDNLFGVVPDYILEEQKNWEECIRYSEKMSDAPPVYHSLKEESVTFAMKCAEYGQSSRMYDIEYTVKNAYYTDTVPENIKIQDNTKGFSNGILEEGYTFLVLDVILENKDERKQMYMMNSISVSDSELLGFSGAQFKNSARLHSELLPKVQFDTSLVFAVPKAAYPQVHIDNFGAVSNDGRDVYVDLEKLLK